LRISREYKTTPLEITAPISIAPTSTAASLTTGESSSCAVISRALGRAMLHSVNVRAYHHCSLLDNFEWAEAMPGDSASLM